MLRCKPSCQDVSCPAGPHQHHAPAAGAEAKVQQGVHHIFQVLDGLAVSPHHSGSGGFRLSGKLSGQLRGERAGPDLSQVQGLHRGRFVRVEQGEDVGRRGGQFGLPQLGVAQWNPGRERPAVPDRALQLGECPGNNGMEAKAGQGRNLAADVPAPERVDLLEQDLRVGGARTGECFGYLRFGGGFGKAA